FVCDCGLKILNLDQSLADEYDLGHFRDASDPRVAGQLGIEGQQPARFFRIATRCGLPFQQTALTVQRSDGVDIGNEIVVAGNWPRELDLQIAARLTNANAIVLTAAVQK